MGLVAADGFYGRQGTRGSKRPCRIEGSDDGVFSFAGIWGSWSEFGDNFRSMGIIT